MAPRRMTPRKMISGRSVEVKGLQQLEANIRDIIDASKGEKVTATLDSILGWLYRDIVSAAKAVNVPHEVLDDIFTYNKPHPSDRSLVPHTRTRGRVTALIGIRKKGRHAPWAKAYAEWFPGKHMAMGTTSKTPKISKQLVIPGTMSAKGAAFGKQMIGESLATMWELGTSIMAARPFFRPTIKAARARVIQQFADCYRGIIASHSAK